MKKINVIALAFLGALSIQTMAAAETISVKSDNAVISYTYSLENDNEAVFDAEKLFTKLNEISSVESSVSDTFVITNNSENATEVVLRLELDSLSDNWTYSPLDYYSFTITDEAGNIVYNSLNADLSDVSDISKDISLGVFNGGTSEKTYKIEYKLSEDGTKNLLREDFSDITISLVTRNTEATNETEKAAEISERNPAPKFEITTEQSTQAPISVAQVAQAPVSEAQTEAPQNEAEKQKKFVCGTDITPGRYVVTGNGVVVVESEAGNLESKIVLNDGIAEYTEDEASGVITLTDGDVVTLTPLEGQEKASVSVEKTNTGANDESTVRPNTVADEQTKLNPKTGEENTTVFLVIMILSVMLITALEIVKRRKVK